MRTITLTKYNSKYFPILAKTQGYSNTFTTTESAKFAMASRFGKVKFIDKTGEKTNND
jgi:hypothetical protein